MSKSEEFMQAMKAYDDGETDVALKLIEECASQGDPEACFIAALWLNGEEGFTQNLTRSKQWLDELVRLAEIGVAKAQWELGQHLRFGNLMPADIKQANYWLERAATGGQPEAQHHLAWFLEMGQYGYSVDMDLAKVWYMKAIEQKHPETLYLYATRVLETGTVTDEAASLLREAAEKGFEPAKIFLNSKTH